MMYFATLSMAISGGDAIFGADGAVQFDESINGEDVVGNEANATAIKNVCLCFTLRYLTHNNN